MLLHETLILVLYFFVLSMLAIYGWHRYYLVYLYMKHKGNVPPPLPPLAELPPVTVQLPIFNEMYVADRLIDAVCEIDYPRELLEIQVLDDSTDETRRHRRARGPTSCRPRLRHQVPASRRSPRLQGRGARSRPEGGLGQVHRDLRRRLRAADGLPDAHAAATSTTIRRSAMVQARWGHLNQRLLAADADPVDSPRRPLRPRARRPQPRRLLLQLQRDGRGLAPRQPSPTPAAGSTTR